MSSKSDGEVDNDKTKLAPEVPDSVLKYWYVEDKKNNFEVRRLSENNSAKAFISWNHKSCTVKDSIGREIKLYKAFKDAQLIALHNKYQDKKRLWDTHVKASMLLNDQITDILDQIHELERDGDDD